MNSIDAIEPFKLSIEDAALTDLKRRLADTRWPESAPVPGWEQGVPLQELQKLCAYWSNSYDCGGARRG